MIYKRQVKHSSITSRCGFIIYCLVILILVSCRNGIGNMHMTMQGHERDDSVSQQAFAGEESFGSDLEQAINYERKSKNTDISQTQKELDAERSQRRTFLIGLLVLLSISCIVIIMLVYIIRLRSQRNRLIHQVEKMRAEFFTNITHEYGKPIHVDELNVCVERLLEQRRILQTKYSKVIHEKTSSEEDASVITDRDKDFLIKVTDAIKDQISSGKIDYDLLASTLCLSRAHLNRKIKAITGETTTDLILKIKISLAKNLLDNTDKSIIEITMDCGMDSDSYFCTLFKKATGQTPLQYRNRKNWLSRESLGE